VTRREFEHTATPVTWSPTLGRVTDHVLVAIAVLAVAPRPLWAWVVLVQPAIALVAVPWYGTLALAAFVVISVAPAVIAWVVALRQRRLRYTVSPTRATLQVRPLRTDSTAEDDSEPIVVDLHSVDEIAAVPLRVLVAVRFNRDRTEGEPGLVPRVVLIPVDRWPTVAAALTQAGVSLPWGEEIEQRPPLAVFAIVAASAVVSILGVTFGAGLVFWWVVLA